MFLFAVKRRGYSWPDCALDHKSVICYIRSRNNHFVHKIKVVASTWIFLFFLFCLISVFLTCFSLATEGYMKTNFNDYGHKRDIFPGTDFVCKIKEQLLCSQDQGTLISSQDQGTFILFTRSRNIYFIHKSKETVILFTTSRNRYFVHKIKDQIFCAQDEEKVILLSSEVISFG